MQRRGVSSRPRTSSDLSVGINFSLVPVIFGSSFPLSLVLHVIFAFRIHPLIINLALTGNVTQLLFRTFAPNIMSLSFLNSDPLPSRHDSVGPYVVLALLAPSPSEAHLLVNSPLPFHHSSALVQPPPQCFTPLPRLFLSLYHHIAL